MPIDEEARKRDEVQEASSLGKHPLNGYTYKTTEDIMIPCVQFNSPDKSSILAGAFAVALAPPHRTPHAVSARFLKAASSMNLIPIYQKYTCNLPLSAALAGMTTELAAQKLRPFTPLKVDRIFTSGIRYGYIFSFAPTIERKLNEALPPGYPTKLVSGGIAGTASLFFSEIPSIARQGTCSYLQGLGPLPGIKKSMVPIMGRLPGLTALGAIAYALFSPPHSEMR